MTSDGERLATARRLLDELGVRLEDLVAEHHTAARVVPTWAEYLPQVITAAGPGASRTYGSYWNRMITIWGTRALDEVSASDIEALQHTMAATARSLVHHPCVSDLGWVTDAPEAPSSYRPARLMR